MHPRTIATLRGLETVHWFGNAGVRDNDLSEVTTSWDDAIVSCRSRRWQDLKLDATNQYSLRLLERSRQRYNRWNDVVNQLKPFTEALVDDRLRACALDQQIVVQIVGDLRWDMLHLAIEAEYADVFPPGFYAGLSYWYTTGHFPCGYNGPFPGGRIVIF